MARRAPNHDVSLRDHVGLQEQILEVSTHCMVTEVPRKGPRGRLIVVDRPYAFETTTESGIDETERHSPGASEEIDEPIARCPSGTDPLRGVRLRMTVDQTELNRSICHSTARLLHHLIVFRHVA